MKKYETLSHCSSKHKFISFTVSVNALYLSHGVDMLNFQGLVHLLRVSNLQIEVDLFMSKCGEFVAEAELVFTS